MRASIVVVSYNSRAYLGACLASLSSAAGPDDELIVVDNGSTDGSADLVAACFPSVRLIHAENTGYAGGNNRGAAAAEGDYLVFINPDTIAHPGAIDALVAPLAGDVALTTARIVLCGKPDTINACGNTVHITGLTYCRGAGRPAIDYEASCNVDAVSGAAFAIRRDVFVTLGGFDERFFMYVEDTDLSLRARLAGYRIRYMSGAVVEHDYHMTYSPTKAYYLDRNRHLMLLKNLSSAAYARLLPALLLGEIITWAFLLLKGPRYWGVKPQIYAAIVAARPWASRSYTTSAAERTLLAGLAYQLDFGQLAGRWLSAALGIVIHPAFRLTRALLQGGPQ
jgi:GT2 family glycosyltransferase